jgi:hypothetical protein
MIYNVQEGNLANNFCLTVLENDDSDEDKTINSLYGVFCRYAALKVFKNKFLDSI